MTLPVLMPFYFLFSIFFFELLLVGHFGFYFSISQSTGNIEGREREIALLSLRFYIFYGYYELGPDNPPYAAKFYNCCGAARPVSMFRMMTIDPSALIIRW
ncbi:uncharacterized protein LOC125475678 isoform X2 [Pyrus x bretschneideri]|uniref:uncharacterized protein LOC125475678 isoform X2 n=1 Tax=Pyrus x bretschneideri TaxID=225117 RepID=UPI002030A7D9|nr:uncharacterized protein LOC125475678 isoform X2 [Pyrus x bretschneideri]